MDGVKALAVLASVYYPGDGIVAKDNYQTSSGERYDQSAPKCAALQWPLGTMLHLVHGRNNIDVTINDYGPYHKGRALDCTPAVDKALHLGGLGSVRVEPYPPLPKARPVEAEVATQSGTDPMDATPAVDKALHLGDLGSVRVEPYPPLPKARPVEAEVATRSGTDPMDATVTPPAGYDSDRSSRPLPADDGPKHFYQPKRMGAARLRAHTPSVALGNSSQGYARGLFFLPPW